MTVFFLLLLLQKKATKIAMKTAGKRILGYCRVSTREQAEDGRASLPAQEQVIRGVALIAGIDTVEIFTDPGVMGGTALADRPAGSCLCKALMPGDIVVASKMDRIFRSASDALATVERWKAQGVDLILVDCGTEPVSTNGNSKLFFGILASVAEFEKSRIAERMHMGRAGKKAAGGHIGGLPPYGFRKVGHGRAAMLEPDPAEQRLIAQIHSMRRAGMTLNGISAELEARGMLMRSGKPFSPYQLHRIIHASTERTALLTKDDAPHENKQ